MGVMTIILTIIGILLGLGIFFSYVTGMGKTFQKSPASVSIQSERVKSQQRSAAQNAAEKQKQMMDNIKQKIRDNQKF